jgi:hypothetical protein
MLMKREFYEIHMTVVDANGNVTIDPSGYPKIEDSKLRAHDLLLTLKRASGLLGAAESAMSTQDTRQIQYAYIIRGSDGKQIDVRRFGALEDIDIPDENEGE